MKCQREGCPIPVTGDNVLCSAHRRSIDAQGQATPDDAAWVEYQRQHPGQRAQIVCPHCYVRGQVSRRAVKLKKGVSGAKATGAIFTAGLSLIGTGLSRKESATEMHCGNCGTDWTV